MIFAQFNNWTGNGFTIYNKDLKHVTNRNKIFLVVHDVY